MVLITLRNETSTPCNIYACVKNTDGRYGLSWTISQEASTTYLIDFSDDMVFFAINSACRSTLSWPMTLNDAQPGLEKELYINIKLIPDYSDNLHAVREFKSVTDVGDFFKDSELLNDVVLFVMANHGFVSPSPPSNSPNLLPRNTRLVSFTPVGNTALGIAESAYLASSWNRILLKHTLEHTWHYIMAINKMRILNTSFKTTDGEECTTLMGTELINRRMIVELSGSKYEGNLYPRRQADDPIFSDMTQHHEELSSRRKWHAETFPIGPPRLREWTSVSGQGLTIHNSGETYNDQVFEGKVHDGDLGVMIGFIRQGEPKFVFIKMEDVLENQVVKPDADLCTLSQILRGIIPDLNRGLTRPNSAHNIWIGHPSCRLGGIIPNNLTDHRTRKLSLAKSSSMNCYLKSFIINIFNGIFDLDKDKQAHLSSWSYDKVEELLSSLIQSSHKGKVETDSRYLVKTALSQITYMKKAFASKAIMKMPDFYDYLAMIPGGAAITREWTLLSGEWTGKHDIETSQKEYAFIMKYISPESPDLDPDYARSLTSPSK